MTYDEHQFGDLRVEIHQDDATGRVTTANLYQDSDIICLRAPDLYDLIGTVAAVDPEEWARRFPDKGIEQVLTQIKAVLRAKGLANVELAGQSKGAARTYYLNVAEGLRQAIAFIQEEQDKLAQEQPHVCDPDIDHDHDPIRPSFCNWCGDKPEPEYHPEGSVAHINPWRSQTQAVNENLNRRRA